jgi:uncharacterized RDD family membrane protein YckC
MAYQETPGYPGQGPATPGYGSQGTPYAAASAGIPYVEWPARAGAYLIDIAPVIAGLIVFLILTSIVGNFFFTVLLYLILIAGSIAWGVYNRWIQGGQGQTLGKRQLKIKMVSEEDGQPIGTWRAFLRDLCHVYDNYLLFGYLLPIWDPKHQTQADKIMKTIIVPADQ